ncbi:LuxR C-terminal-related transcriptional regulator [Chitiniphilus shinanonensis]|nr:LuxR C-terminal-related transcriptional regulator [Chitiniphilus shinanonensis]
MNEHVAYRAVAQKLVPPDLVGQVLQRPELLTRLAAMRAHRITVLHAPAGYGKTFSMRMFYNQLSEAGEQVAWVSIDSADCDLPRLLLLLRAALFGLDGGGEKLLFEAPPCTLFMDDFERLLSKGAAFNPIALLADILPSHVRLVLGTRVLGSSGLARYRVSQVLAELDTDALRFTRQEADAYFRMVCKQEYSSELLGAVYDRTEGWPAAQQLIALAFNQSRAGFDPLRSTLLPQELTEYLVDELFEVQNRNLRDFLLDTAMLCTFTAGLCDHLLQRSNSDAMIDELLAQGLPLQSRGDGWYSYHPLFAEQLRRIGAARPEGETSNLALRAGRWFLEQDRPHEAIGYLLHAQAHDEAIAVLDAIAQSMLVRAQFNTLVDWCRAVPRSILKQHRSLCILYATALAYAGESRPARFWLRYLALVARHHPEDQAFGDSVRSLELLVQQFGLPDFAQISQVAEESHSLLDHNDPIVRGREASLLALAALSRSDFVQAEQRVMEAKRIHRAAGNMVGLGNAFYIEAAVAATQGRLIEALAHIDSVDRMTAHGDTYVAPGVLHLFSAGFRMQVTYELGRMTEVDGFLNRYGELVRKAPSFQSVLKLTIVEARIAAMRNNAGLAVQLLDDLANYHPLAQTAEGQRLIDFELARLAITAGNQSKIQAYADMLLQTPFDLDLLSSISSIEDAEGAGLAHARLMLHAGGDWLLRGLALLQALLEHAERSGRRWRHNKLLILYAVGLRLAGNEPAACEAMGEAVRLAGDTGVMRSFFDEGPHALALLGMLNQQKGLSLTPSQQAHFDTLLGQLATQPVSQRPMGSASLTPRELEILRALAAGVCNKRIAKDMDIAPNTVKWHLASIYSKLLVRNRVQAIDQARRQGLLYGEHA